MEIDTLQYTLLEDTVGIPIEIITNEFREIADNTYHRIIFQIKEEEPDLLAMGVLFSLSLMSFSFSAPRGISEMYFIPDEEWNLEYFVQGLEFENKCLCFSSDYVSGRLMKTDIVFESGGRVTLTTRNRGRGAERWLTHLQGKKHIQPLK
jgi:hypothetical protein